MLKKAFTASALLNEWFTVLAMLEHHNIIRMDEGKVTIPVTPVQILSLKKWKIVNGFPFWNAKFEQMLERYGGDWVKVLDEFDSKPYVINQGTKKEKYIRIYTGLEVSKLERPKKPETDIQTLW